MKTNVPRILSFVAVIALVGTLVLTTGGSALAAGSKKNIENQEGQTSKIFIVNAMPGDVISAYQFMLDPYASLDHADGNLTPEGSLLESATRVPAGGQLEIFVPTMRPNAIYVWNEKTGYHFLANVATSDSETQLTLDASKAK